MPWQISELSLRDHKRYTSQEPLPNNTRMASLATNMLKLFWSPEVAQKSWSCHKRAPSISFYLMKRIVHAMPA